jgi:hypothetical protein
MQAWPEFCARLILAVDNVDLPASHAFDDLKPRSSLNLGPKTSLNRRPGLRDESLLRLRAWGARSFL